MSALYVASCRNIATPLNRSQDGVRLALTDELGYDEPPAFYYPVRESLGGALLRFGKSAEAESVFRECLLQNPRDPRALFGLSEALKAQGKSDAADSIRRLFLESWKNPDVALRVQDL